MALKISDSKSFKLEPMRKNRFVFQFTTIPGNKDKVSESLAFVCKSADVPTLSFETIETKRIHESFKTAGMATWNELNVVFNDFIRNSDNGEEVVAAGDAMYNWCSMIYNPLTGQMGYKTQYATSATEAQFDPAGNIIRAWNIFGIFPKSVNFGGTLSYEDAGATEVQATFVYDIAIKITDAKVSGESA